MFYLTRYGSVVTKDFGCPSLRDIAYGLSQLVRYNGASPREITVATHSLLVYELCKYFCPDNLNAQVHCLLHDTAESTVGDVPSPFKSKEFIEMEETILERIYNSFGIELPNEEDKKLVKVFDKMGFRVEVYWYDIGGDGIKDFVVAPTEDDVPEEYRKPLGEFPKKGWFGDMIDYDNKNAPLRDQWASLLESEIRKNLMAYHNTERY